MEGARRKLAVLQAGRGGRGWGGRGRGQGGSQQLNAAGERRGGGPGLAGVVECACIGGRCSFLLPHIQIFSPD